MLLGVILFIMDYQIRYILDWILLGVILFIIDYQIRYIYIYSQMIP